MAPLVGENRHLAQRGLPRLNSGRRLGIRALLEVAGRRASPSCDGELAGWVLAPRLNAFGRLARADRGVRLLLTDDPEEARRLAVEANLLNLERQRLCDQVVARRAPGSSRRSATTCPTSARTGSRSRCRSARTGWPRRASSWPTPAGAPASSAWPPAGWPTPTPGRSRWPRSAASWPGSPCAPARPGPTSRRRSPRSRPRPGSASAAAATGRRGGSLPTARLGDLARVFAGAIAVQAPPEPLARRLSVDAELSLSELTLDACAALARLQPFGHGNPAPTLLVRGLRATEPPRPLGASGRHFRLSLIDRLGVRAGAVWWDVAPDRLPVGRFDALAELERSDFNGSVEVRLVLRAVRPAAGPAARPLELFGPQRAADETIVRKNEVGTPSASTAASTL